mgnify:CR=1 FL=1
MRREIDLPEVRIRPKWRLDRKGRVVLKEEIRKVLELRPGAWGFAEVYEGGKILLTVVDKGVGDVHERP